MLGHTRRSLCVLKIVCPLLIAMEPEDQSGKIANKWLESDSDATCSPPKRLRRSDVMPAAAPAASSSTQCSHGGGGGASQEDSDAEAFSDPGTAVDDCGVKKREDELPAFWARELQAWMREAGAEVQVNQLCLLSACSGTGAPALSLKASSV